MLVESVGRVRPRSTHALRHVYSHARLRRDGDCLAIDRNVKNTITILVQDKCLAGGPALILRVVRGATGLDDLGSKPLTPRRKCLGELDRCLTWRDRQFGRRKKLLAIA